MWFLLFLSIPAFATEFECTSSHFISAPDDIRSSALDTMVELALDKREKMNARAVIRALADSQWTQGFNRLPHFAAKVKRILTHSYQNPKESFPPINADISKIYESYISMVAREPGFFTHRNVKFPFCEVILDAATYFALVGASNIAILYKSYLEQFECNDEFLERVPTFP